MQTNSAVEQNETLNGQIVRGIRQVGDGKVYSGKDLSKSQVLSSEWKTEPLRKDESDDSQDDEDDELPCVWWDVKAKETVSDEARKVQWGVHSIDEVRRTEKSD